MKTTKIQNQPAASSSKTLVIRQLRKARAAITKLLGLETETALDELADSFVASVEEAGEIAREKAIAEAIKEIPHGGRELVERLMTLRDPSVKKASIKKQRDTSSADANTSKKGARRES